MEDKFKTFLEIAKSLNEQGIVPTLSGSLGLYRLIEQLDVIEDIDVIVPTEYVTDKFNDLKSIMEGLGYEQDTTFPHEFTKNGIHVGFDPEADLTGIGDPASLAVADVEGSRFKELSAQHYLALYTKSAEDREKKLQKDQKKVAALTELLKQA